jgi:predicted amidohydrolase
VAVEDWTSVEHSTLSVGIAQINPRLGHVQANFSQCEAAVQRAQALGLDLLVFPELSLTGYHLRDVVATVALRLDSPEFAQLKEWSRQVPLIIGFVEESRDYRFYNSAAYLADGEVRHVHRKVYLPTYGMFDEQRYFARGEQVRTFDLPWGRAALLICEDLWHPSTSYLAALDKALLIICPSSSPLRGISNGESQDDNARYWELINRTYAETFGLFLVYANRVGFEDGVGFWGGSEILDPFGQRLAKGKYYEEDFITATLSLEAVRRKRIASPLLRDENIDLTINELLRIQGR